VGTVNEPLTGTIDRVVPDRVLPTGASGTLWSSVPAHGVVEFGGRSLHIVVPDPDGVLFPTDCGLSLLAALQHELTAAGPPVSALDIGCGSGIYTVALLAAGAGHVTALDVSPASTRVTAANVARNDLALDRLSCVTADLATYAPDHRFDLVVTNPPHLPYDPRYAEANGLETALVGGPDGRRLYDVVVERAGDLLTEHGTMIVAHSSLTDIPRTIGMMRDRGYTHRTIDVCEMDIPLLRYTEHRDVLLTRLAALREANRASFDGTRFLVHSIAFTRTGHAHD